MPVCAVFGCNSSLSKRVNNLKCNNIHLLIFQIKKSTICKQWVSASKRKDRFSIKHAVMAVDFTIFNLAGIILYVNYDGNRSTLIVSAWNENIYFSGVTFFNMQFMGKCISGWLPYCYPAFVNVDATCGRYDRPLAFVIQVLLGRCLESTLVVAREPGLKLS